MRHTESKLFENGYSSESEKIKKVNGVYAREKRKIRNTWILALNRGKKQGQDKFAHLKQLFDGVQIRNY